MHLTGPANWALPGWLDRILPRLAIQARDAASATGLEAGMDAAKAR
jgi:RND superfamily putative drug exporter